MIKRIATHDLRVGMFVQEFCGSWIDHPFWSERFVVANEADLQKIKDSPIREVLIDVTKGHDVEEAGPSPAVVAPAVHLPEPKPATPRPVDRDEELDRAARIFTDSRKVVVDMFGEARLGSMQDADGAATVVEDIAASVARHPMAMIGLARLKSADDYTFMHSVAVSALMVALARTLQFDDQQLRAAGMAGLLHDVGKAQIPLAILNKPGALDEAEWEQMRSHPERGHLILRETRGVSPEALDAVLHHHERTDGTGYPHRISGDQFTQLARMAAICDVYDAITSTRPYKAGWQPTIAIRKMTEWTKGHLDPDLFKAFVKTVGIYPVGSLVRLQSQRLAVVIDHDPAHLLLPTVKVFFSLRSNTYIPPVLINLAHKHVDERIASIEDPAVHGLARVDEIWSAPSVNIA